MRLYILAMTTVERRSPPVPAYLVQTDRGPIVIDTGYGIDMVGAYLIGGGPRIERHNYIVDALAAVGVQAATVPLVIATHFDHDHIGALDAFPQAEIVVQRRQIEAAHAGSPRFAAMRDQWDRPGIRLRVIEGNQALVPGVELIESGGHAPGHQSVLVRLPRTGPVLLAADAIVRSADADAVRARPYDPHDPNETRVSTQKLLALAKREGVKLIVYGHDRDQWSTLKHAPEFYD